MLKLTLVKSAAGNTPTNRRTVKALGLKKTGWTAYHADSASIRGMIRNVQHLLKVEVVEAAPEKKKPAAKPKSQPKAESEAKVPKSEGAKAKAPAKPKATPTKPKASKVKQTE